MTPPDPPPDPPMLSQAARVCARSTVTPFDTINLVLPLFSVILQATQMCAVAQQYIHTAVSKDTLSVS